MDKVRSLEDIKSLFAPAQKAVFTEESATSSEDANTANISVAQGDSQEPEPMRDAQGRSYATGKRKRAIARVWIVPGRGKITVNGTPLADYFLRSVLRMIITQPLIVSQRQREFDVVCSVVGGGLSGQAGAVRHGIARALCFYEPELRPALKSHAFLTRDSRVPERKKYGRRKARRRFQFSKR